MIEEYNEKTDEMCLRTSVSVMSAYLRWCDSCVHDFFEIEHPSIFVMIKKLVDFTKDQVIRLKIIRLLGILSNESFENDSSYFNSRGYLKLVDDHSLCTAISKDWKLDNLSSFEKTVLGKAIKSLSKKTCRGNNELMELLTSVEVKTV